MNPSKSIPDTHYHDTWRPQLDLFEPNEISEDGILKRTPPRLCDNCHTLPAYRTRTTLQQRKLTAAGKALPGARVTKLYSLCLPCYLGAV